MKSITLIVFLMVYAAEGITLGQSLEEKFQNTQSEFNRIYHELRSQLNDAQRAELWENQSEWDRKNTILANKISSLQEKLIFWNQVWLERLKYLNSFLSKTEVMSLGEISKAANQGYNSDGSRWSYEFINNSQQIIHKKILSNLNNGVILLYSDEEYIVTSSTRIAGFGNGETTIRFYDSRTLLEVRALKIPNPVGHVDYSKDRKQFLMLTFPDGKCPSDEHAASALVLVDLHNDMIERVPIWFSFFGLTHFPDDYCTPLWRGDSIYVYYKQEPVNASSIKSVLCKGAPFRNISIKFSPMPVSKTLSLSPHKFSLKPVNLDSLAIAGVVCSKTEGDVLKHANRPPLASAGAVKENNHQKIVFVHHRSPSSIQEIDLSSLSTKIHFTKTDGFYKVGVFKDGVLYAATGNDVLLINTNSAQKLLNIPTPKIPLYSVNGSTSQHQPVARSEMDENMSIFFGHDSGYCFADKTIKDGEVRYIKFDSEGKIKYDSIFVHKADRWINRFLSGNRNNTIYPMRIEPWRKSIRIVSVPAGEDLMDNNGQFSEFSIDTKGIIYGPIPQPHVNYLEPIRKAGFAPENWMVETILKWAYSGGTDYEVLATDMLNDKSYRVLEIESSGGIMCGDEPSMWFSNSTTAMVLSRGRSEAGLYSLDINSGISKKVRAWKWDENDGESFFEPSRKIFFIPCEDGYEIYCLGKDILDFTARLMLSGQAQYAFVLPNGFYAGSPGCESLLRVKAVDGSIDGSSVAKWRNRPAEVLKALGGDSEQIGLLAKVTERWQKKISADSAKPEPKASEIPKIFVPERPPLWATGEAAGFTIEWQRGASPMKNIIVRVNGVVSACFEGDTLPDTTQEKGSAGVTVKLAEGQNWIEIAAEDLDGRRSDLQRFRTILRESAKPTKRYIIALGVSKYRDSALNLEFAAKDATDLAAAIKNITKGETEVLLLTNEQATKDAPAKIRDFLATVTENDEVIAFCAGHGVLDSNLDYVYASYEFDSANPTATGIKLDDLVDSIGSSKSLKRLLLLDTCHSGQVGEKDEMLLAQMDTELPKGVRAVKQRGMSVKPVAGLSAEGHQRFIEEMFLLPGLNRGINIIGASGGAEFALESAQWNNGVFTASIIEALREKKADWNEDGRISVGELRTYLAQRVSELTKGAQKPSVVAAERDQDFDLSKK